MVMQKAVKTLATDMALGTVKVIAKDVNLFDIYSTKHRQALREDEDESELSLDSNGM